MLVMTTTFTSKLEELPPTFDMKMIDIWPLCCLVIPFLEVILRTTIECLNCTCDICIGKSVEQDNTDGDDKEKAAGRKALQVLVGIGGKVAPQKVSTT